MTWIIIAFVLIGLLILYPLFDMVWLKIRHQRMGKELDAIANGDRDFRSK